MLRWARPRSAPLLTTEFPLELAGMPALSDTSILSLGLGTPILSLGLGLANTCYRAPGTGFLCSSSNDAAPLLISVRGAAPSPVRPPTPPRVSRQVWEVCDMDGEAVLHHTASSAWMAAARAGQTGLNCCVV